MARRGCWRRQCCGWSLERLHRHEGRRGRRGRRRGRRRSPWAGTAAFNHAAAATAIDALGLGSTLDGARDGARTRRAVGRAAILVSKLGELYSGCAQSVTAAPLHEIGAKQQQQQQEQPIQRGTRVHSQVDRWGRGGRPRGPARAERAATGTCMHIKTVPVEGGHQTSHPKGHQGHQRSSTKAIRGHQTSHSKGQQRPSERPSEGYQRAHQRAISHSQHAHHLAFTGALRASVNARSSPRS